MLFLHAADLHLGKTLHERDLSPDQEAMLERLLELLSKHRPAALLLAGDLYDRSIPPPEAVRLFDSFLSRAMEADPALAIIAIPGNHDSAARLSFGTSIMRRAGLHIRTDPSKCDEPVIVERGGEAVAVWPLPFLGASAGSGAGQAGLFAEAVGRIGARLGELGRGRGIRNILLAHCFASGAFASDSERAFIGSAEQVDASAFSAFDYVALGHLHRFQAAGATGLYSGSPIAYSFAEGSEPKGFVLVDLKASGGFEAELLPVTPLHAMRRIEGPFSVLSAPGAYPECRGDFVEARLTDSEPVLNPADPLRANFPELLSVRQAAFELPAAGSQAAGLPASGALPRGASVAEDFAAFHREMRGEAPDEEASRLFGALLEEATREAL
jgi:exonuclease SbcD